MPRYIILLPLLACGREADLELEYVCTRSDSRTTSMDSPLGESSPADSLASLNSASPLEVSLSGVQGTFSDSFILQLSANGEPLAWDYSGAGAVDSCPTGDVVEVPLEVSISSAEGLTGTGEGKLVHGVTGDVFLALSVSAEVAPGSVYEPLFEGLECGGPATVSEIRLLVPLFFSDENVVGSLGGSLEVLLDGPSGGCSKSILGWSQTAG